MRATDTSGVINVDAGAMFYDDADEDEDGRDSLFEDGQSNAGQSSARFGGNFIHDFADDDAEDDAGGLGDDSPSLAMAPAHVQEADDVPAYRDMREWLLRAPLPTGAKYTPYSFPTRRAVREPWHAVSAEDLERGPTFPARALVMQWPAEMLRGDAEYFRDFERWPTNPTRTKAAAALLGLLFAGVQKGMPSGNHDEEESCAVRPTAKAKRNSTNANGDAEAPPPPLKEVDRYVYREVCEDGPSVVQPMFQVAAEELLDEAEQVVVGMRVWILVYDEHHSHSHLVSRLMHESLQLKFAVAPSGQMSHLRDHKEQAESQRHEKSGVGFDRLDERFEETVGFQWKHITNEEQLLFHLEVHGGATHESVGRPFHRDVHEHCSGQPMARRMQGDKAAGIGGRHPLAPEFVFNAKRAEALSFGLTDRNGCDIPVCAKQLDVRNYWWGGQDGPGGASDPDNPGCYLRVPEVGEGGRATFFMCKSIMNRDTIFNARLPRPFLGSVKPGEALTRVFTEMALRRGRTLPRKSMSVQEEIHELWFGSRGLCADDYMKLTSFARGKNESVVQNEERLRASSFTHDMQAALSLEAASVSGVLKDMRCENGSGEAVIEVQQASTRVRSSMQRLHSEILTEWRALHSANAANAGNAAQPYDAQWLENIFYEAKRDLVQYHIRMLQTCFQSTAQARTLPAGYRAMNEGLRAGVAANGGSASIAFAPGHGRQLQHKDRTVWAQTQEWLGQMWQVHCLIEGRDRRIMASAPPHVAPAHIPHTKTPPFPTV